MCPVSSQDHVNRVIDNPRKLWVEFIECNIKKITRTYLYRWIMDTLFNVVYNIHTILFFCTSQYHTRVQLTLNNNNHIHLNFTSNKRFELWFYFNDNTSKVILKLWITHQVFIYALHNIAVCVFKYKVYII